MKVITPMRVILGIVALVVIGSWLIFITNRDPSSTLVKVVIGVQALFWFVLPVALTIIAYLKGRVGLAIFGGIVVGFMILGLIAAMNVPDAGLFLAFLPIPVLILLVGAIRKARPGSVWARKYPPRVSKTSQT